VGIKRLGVAAARPLLETVPEQGREWAMPWSRQSTERSRLIAIRVTRAVTSISRTHNSRNAKPQAHVVLVRPYERSTVRLSLCGFLPGNEVYLSTFCSEHPPQPRRRPRCQETPDTPAWRTPGSAARAPRRSLRALASIPDRRQPGRFRAFHRGCFDSWQESGARNQNPPNACEIAPA